jgi:hypothetical protein
MSGKETPNDRTIKYSAVTAHIQSRDGGGKSLEIVREIFLLASNMDEATQLDALAAIKSLWVSAQPYSRSP